MASSDVGERWVIPDEGASLLVGSVLGILASRIECARWVISCFAREAGRCDWLCGMDMDSHGHGRGVVVAQRRKVATGYSISSPPRKNQVTDRDCENGIRPLSLHKHYPCPSPRAAQQPLNGSMTSRLCGLSASQAGQSCVASSRTVIQLWDQFAVALHAMGTESLSVNRGRLLGQQELSHA